VVANSNGRVTVRERVLLVVVTVVGLAVSVSWIVTAARTAGYGFDITDEGYYLLSYRWWDSNPLALTGVQYLFGPIFELLDWDIVKLRIFRLVTIVGWHLFFGWSFMRWLRVRRPTAPRTWIWEAAGISLVLAAGGMCYSWLPLSPGYNDVVLLGSLVGTSCVLWAATAAARGKNAPIWALLLFGFTVTVMLLAKWSSVVVLAVIGVALVLVLLGQGWEAVARGIVWGLIGAVALVLVVQLALVPLTVAVPGILAVNRFIAETSYTPTALISMYWTSGIKLFGEALKQHYLLFIAGIIAVVSRYPTLRKRHPVLRHPLVWLAVWEFAAVGLGLSIYRVLQDGGLGGGSANNGKFQVTLLAAVLVAIVVGLVAKRWTGGKEDLATWAILGTLFLLPIIQAFGTNNPLYIIGFNAFAAWAALMIAVVTNLETAQPVAKVTTALVTVTSLVAVAAIAYGGLMLNPYRSSRHEDLTTATSVGPLGSLKLTPNEAQRYGDLVQTLKPYTTPEGRPILAFDKLAGIVLMLGGRPFGEAWVAPNERERAAAGIVHVCSADNKWPGDREPLLIFNREVGQLDIDALRSCGLDFWIDYKLLAPPQTTMSLRIYVPWSDPVAQTP
jgi:hypothetical protein